MTCSTGKQEAANASVGLVPNHAYSLMDVLELVDSTGGILKLLKVRNPHAKTAWRGDWSESSPFWTTELRRQAGYNEAGAAGVFFIAFHDFLQWFQCCTICRIHGPEWHECRRSLQLPSGYAPCVGLALEAAETAECLVSLVQPEERTRLGPLYDSDIGPLACLGFVLVSFDAVGQGNGAAAAVGHLQCRAVISQEIWLQRGQSYLLVPLGLHDKGPAVPIVFSCASSKAVTVTERELGPEAVRAAWAAYARSGAADNFHGAVLYTAKARGGAVVAMAENRGFGHLNTELSFTSDPLGALTYARSSSLCNDWLAPGYGQILQVVLPDGSHRGSVSWSSQHKFQMQVMGPGRAWHEPDLDVSTYVSLHTPFQLST